MKLKIIIKMGCLISFLKGCMDCADMDCKTKIIGEVHIDHKKVDVDEEVSGGGLHDITKHG